MRKSHESMSPWHVQIINDAVVRRFYNLRRLKLQGKLLKYQLILAGLNSAIARLMSGSGYNYALVSCEGWVAKIGKFKFARSFPKTFPCERVLWCLSFLFLQFSCTNFRLIHQTFKILPSQVKGSHLSLPDL